LTLLTKVFIVLHVVVSLLLAAGLIVFVNRTENFKTTSVQQKAALATANAALQRALVDAKDQASYADAARVARDNAIADGQKALAAAEAETSTARQTLADAQAGLKIAQVTQDNLTAALTASEAGRKALSDNLDSTRTDNNTLTTKNSQLNLAIADLTSRLEVAKRLVSDYQETIAQQKEKIEKDDKLIADAHLNPATPAGLEAGAPPIDAVVRSTRDINGIPYATISVGADAQVQKGMKFSVVDRDKKEFLGELTIDQVDEKESTGKLEGPHLSDIKAGTEVKTQL
jgi:hypothetical protein